MQDGRPINSIQRKHVIAIVAVAFANAGLYFIAYIFTPILTGALAAYMMRRKQESLVVAFIGSAMAYIPLEVIAAPQIADYLVESGILTSAELQASIGSFYFILIGAALLLSVIASAASFLFSVLFNRISS